MKRIFRKLLKYKQIIKNRYCRLKVRWLSYFYDGVIVFGENIIFHVPVCCNGFGRVAIGDNVMFGYDKAFVIGNGSILVQARKKDSNIAIGNNTAISNNVSIIANKSIEIGENCMLGELVSIVDSDFHNIIPDLRHKSRGKVLPVKIGDNVWLGSRVTVLKGVTIGDNSVIAAGGVVTKDVPDNVVAAGVPAVVIKEL